MTDVQKEDGEWEVGCSDEESYAPAGVDKPDLRNWEPTGVQIALLYKQLEKIGSIDLKWQCPGRRSPSVHSNTTGAEKKSQELSDQAKKVVEPNEFDFDDDAFDEPVGQTSKLAVRRKSTTQGN